MREINASDEGGMLNELQNKTKVRQQSTAHEEKKIDAGECGVCRVGVESAI